MPDLLVHVVGANMKPNGIVIIANAVASNGAMAPVTADVPMSQSSAQVNNAIEAAAIAAMAERGVVIGGGDIVTIVGGAV